MNTKFLAAWLLLASLACAMNPHAEAALVHQYRLDGSYADDLGGPALVPAGGVLGATSYAFEPNQGLSLENALIDADNYTIETIFNFAETSGYRKIIDFKDQAADRGLYNLNSALNFYLSASGTATVFTPNVDVRLIVTRDATTNQFIGYINGVQQISFADTAEHAVFSGTNNIMRFFTDDTATSGEASSGVVDAIRIYDAPLNPNQVAALGGPGPIPEPTTLFLVVTALVAATSPRRKPRS